MTRVCILAAPLVARSGVYKSTTETVMAARANELPWTGILGVASRASGTATTVNGIREFAWDPRGARGVVDLARYLRGQEQILNSDIIVSMNPQADMALALARVRPFVSYMRGLPWPEPGEGSRPRALLWQGLERLALRHAAEVWCTTEKLAGELPLPTTLVPPGIASLTRTWDGRGSRDLVVWAARFDHDKNPQLFRETMRGSSLSGAMYGVGPLEEELVATLPPNVHRGGWVASDELFDEALVYVGTSWREAFGRSAVEAAMRGVPVVLSQSFGCAKLLYTDQGLREMFVLDPTGGPAPWREAIERLHLDEELRARVSGHLVLNASKLSIESSVTAMKARLDGLTSAG